MDHKVYEMTFEGIRKLEDELERRKGEGRTEIADRIKQALSFGDISENSEYDDAKNAQAENEARIAEIEAILKHAKVIDEDDISIQKVTIGALVSVREEPAGDEMECKLVSAQEEDIFAKPMMISSDSPLGTAILGKKKGQTVDVHSPSGMIKYKVLKISRPESRKD